MFSLASSTYSSVHFFCSACFKYNNKKRKWKTISVFSYFHAKAGMSGNFIFVIKVMSFAINNIQSLGWWNGPLVVTSFDQSTQMTHTSVVAVDFVVQHSYVLISKFPWLRLQSQRIFFTANKRSERGNFMCIQNDTNFSYTFIHFYIILIFRFSYTSWYNIPSWIVLGVWRCTIVKDIFSQVCLIEH